ncbi:aldo/keto reductase [Parafrigoribacterium humi]|uniref:aldo/keto reductase n=1 Tax=Parafrigoribacterium humi TaxID=3144664 RepID=UPI0032EB9CDB
MRLVEREIAGIGLGTAQFAFRDAPRRQSVEVVMAALESGVRLIDTALAYTRQGERSYAESVVAEALARWKGDRPIVATKGGHFRHGDSFPIDARPQALRSHLEMSREALGVERIDLYQLHHVDPLVPLQESVAALEELRREGLIEAIGLSNVSVEALEEARAVAMIASVQNRLSFDVREDLDTVARCQELGIAYLAYMPFGGPDGHPSEPVVALARARKVSTQRVQLAWLRSLSPCVLPLVGASRPESIRDSAVLLHLDVEELATLDTPDARASV